MPPNSRAQRRRQSQRAAPRPHRPAEASAPLSEEAEPLDAAEAVIAPPAPASPAPGPAPSARTARPGRRSAARAPEPVDYSQDYASARRDLTRIAIISSLIFAVMVALSFSGLL